MEKYLSIGEVVKMKGVSHRSLRHYDAMGILVPAYVNEETGYRYYSRSQMLVLDVITLCVVFGIPLKQFKDYILADGAIDAQKMAHDARQKAFSLQRKIEQNLYFLDSLAEHFADTQEQYLSGQTYTKRIKERYFLTTPAPKSKGSWSDYWTNMTKLYAKADKSEYSMSVNQGLCFFKKDAVVQAKYFLEIKAPEKLDTALMIIPEAEFHCEIFEDSCLFDALNTYMTHENDFKGHMLIFNDILERKITQKSVPFEAQLLKV